jgi:nicotinate-nucleotide adenylyltransferase
MLQAIDKLWQQHITDMDALRERVREALGERRFAHTLGCEKLAALLAQKYGADERVVRASALLHDITKELSLAQQLRLCEKWSIIHDYDGDNLEAVIHADTGAAAAAFEYGMGSAVCSAIRKHTVGDESMSLTDRIIYIADACEETRRYPGAREMRELALRDLNAAVISNMEQTIKRLENLGKKPYYKTERALAALIKEKEGKKINE